jgi:c(7)-type cytochrome triheme protein
VRHVVVQKALIPLLLAACTFGASVPRIASPAPPGVEVRLPADIVYAPRDGADSAVVFSHRTHFAIEGNRCTGCHPATFRMLTRGPAPSHGNMNAGRSCGVCHNGRDAFGVTDTTACTTCHTGRPEAHAASSPASGAGAAVASTAPRLPKPHAYPRGDGSPGRVTFRHETHAKGGCAACHPRTFKMIAAPPLPDFGMHGVAACGACHDGKAAFATDDPASCERCHRDEGGTP